MRVDLFDYDLPPELIAQRPAERRDESRLLVYERGSGAIRHRRFSELPEELAPNELVVVNDTRVIHARLRIRRAGGGEAEVLLLERAGPDGVWEGLARPSRRLRAGQRLGPVELIEPLGKGRWLLRLEGEPAGDVPLPPYITAPLEDPDRFQTVYGRLPGSAAAPTAGLHFTPELLAQLQARGIGFATATLHVGLDTFRPVRAADLTEHEIHAEVCSVPEETARAVNESRARGGRIVAVGTHSELLAEVPAYRDLLAQESELAEVGS